MSNFLDEITKDPEKKAKLLLLYKIGVLLSYIFIVLGIIFFFLMVFFK